MSCSLSNFHFLWNSDPIIRSFPSKCKSSLSSYFCNLPMIPKVPLELIHYVIGVLFFLVFLKQWMLALRQGATLRLLRVVSSDCGMECLPLSRYSLTNCLPVFVITVLVIAFEKKNSLETSIYMKRRKYMAIWSMNPFGRPERQSITLFQWMVTLHTLLNTTFLLSLFNK